MIVEVAQPRACFDDVRTGRARRQARAESIRCRRTLSAAESRQTSAALFLVVHRRPVPARGWQREIRERARGVSRVKPVNYHLREECAGLTRMCRVTGEFGLGPLADQACLHHADGQRVWWMSRRTRCEAAYGGCGISHATYRPEQR